MKKSALAITLASLLSPVSSLQAQETSADETIVVTANRFEKVDAAVLAQSVVVTKEDIERLQAVSLVDIFKTLPSIEISQYGGRGQTASIHVRGGSSSQVLVLVDGIRMPRAMMVVLILIKYRLVVSSELSISVARELRFMGLKLLRE